MTTTMSMIMALTGATDIANYDDGTTDSRDIAQRRLRPTRYATYSPVDMKATYKYETLIRPTTVAFTAKQFYIQLYFTIVYGSTT